MRPILKDQDDSALIDFLDTIDGKSLIKQSLLTKCVHMVLDERQNTHMVGEKFENESKDALQKTLKYLHNFREKCAQAYDKTLIEDFNCAYEQMLAAEIDDQEVKRCYDESFVEATNLNLLLE